jgi:hypothetical protein
MNFMLLTQKFSIKFSTILFVLILYIHVGAILCIAFCDILMYLKIVLYTLIVISFLACFYKNLWPKNPNLIIKLWCDSDNIWHLGKMNDDEIVAILQGSSVITNILCVLNFKGVDKKYYSITILRDTMSKADYRKLKFIILTK